MVSFQTVLLIGVCFISSPTHPFPKHLAHNILYVGGNLGPVVTEEFRRSPFQVTILSRQGSTSRFPEGVPVIGADYDDPHSLKVAMQGQDVVISMVGDHVAGDQNRFIDAALAAGVKRFFPSEFGPYSRNPEFSGLIPAVLPAKAGTSSLATGAWFEWAMKTGVLGFDLTSKTVTLINGGTTVLTTTMFSTVSKALVAMLEHPDETRNTYIFVSSFNVSQRDILEAVEKVDGQKWTTKHITSEEVIASGKSKLAAGDFTGIMDLVWGGACGKQGLGDSRPYGLWNIQLGLPKEGMEKATRDVILDIKR